MNVNEMLTTKQMINVHLHVQHSDLKSKFTKPPPPSSGERTSVVAA